MSSTKKPAAKSKDAESSKSSESKSSHEMLKDFFTDEIKDIYWAEKKLVTTLPKMKKAATSGELQEAFGNHLEETKGHVARLEEVFEILGEKPVAKKCDAMAGIVEEGEGIIEETEEGTATRDVGLILAAQKVEHYEIATYGGLAQLAKTLGLEDIATILESTLSEEKNADHLLTEVAENHVNYEAVEE